MFVKNLVRSITGDILGGVAFGAGMALVNEFVDSRTGRNSIPAGNYVPQSVPNNNNGTTIANIALARIALCYYIAKADQVKPDEQEKIDQMCEELLNDPEMNPDYRYELRMILADKGKSFSNVRRYLNRIDPKELSQFKADVIRIAETTNGITENEKKALSVFYEYMASQNSSPVDDDGNEKAARTRIVSLKCQSCGASLEVGADQTLAYCPYCGSNHLIDMR